MKQWGEIMEDGIPKWILTNTDNYGYSFKYKRTKDGNAIYVICMLKGSIYDTHLVIRQETPKDFENLMNLMRHLKN